MKDANAFLKRMLLVVAISALSLANVVYAHGGGHGSGGSSGGSGSSGSSGGGGHSSGSTSGGHSSSSTSGGHSSSSTSGGHSASSTSGGHSATASKGGRSAADPSNVSQSPATTSRTIHEGRAFHVFEQHGSSYGYNSQNTETNRRRLHWRRLFGFIPY